MSREGYQDWYGSAVVEIKPQTITDITLNGWSGYYDGFAHSITVNDHQANTDTILYSTDGETYTLTENPQYVKVGTYTTYVKVSREGYQDWYGSAVVKVGLVVTTLEDVVDETDGQISLREAVELYANEGNTVTFAPELAEGTIVLGGTWIEITKGIAIDASDIGGITIDGNAQSGIILVNGDVCVELTNLVLTNGNAPGGGGIYNGNGTLTLTNCSIVGNTAYQYGGGGLFCIGNSSLILTNCLVSENYCYGSYGGGGIYNNDGTVTITNTTISKNFINYSSGGGICNNHGTMILNRCTVSNNTSSSDMGWGGGIVNAGTMTVTDSIIFGNLADTKYYGGGGILNTNTLTLTNTIISGNYANLEGGGLYNHGTAILHNCSLVGNSADISGDGIKNQGTLYCYNSIIAQNDESDIDSSPSYGVEGTSYAYNTLSSFTNWTDSENCLVYNANLPLFTDPENSDYTLARNSQALNAGNNEYVVEELDLIGNARIVGESVDLGAYERQKLETPSFLTGEPGFYVSYGANRHKLTWETVNGATDYELAYSTDGETWNSFQISETSVVVTGLVYGSDVMYKVRALSRNIYDDSSWSELKTFNVCPMDVNGDGDISGADRAILSLSWLSEGGDADYIAAADINADGDVSNADRTLLSNNWLGEVGDDDLIYPQPLAADIVFAGFEFADLETDLDVF